MPNAPKHHVRSRPIAVATVIALLLGLVPSLVTVCVGWQASAMARMACCAKVHENTSEAKADGCCQSGEQRAHARADGGVVSVVSPDVPVAGFVTEPPRVPPTERLHNVRSRAPEVATYLLLATFLL